MQPEQQQPSSQPQSQWQYNPETNQSSAQQSQPTNQPEISWSASEFIAYQKNAGWYTGMIVGVIVLAVVIFLVTSGDWISSATTVIIGILFVAYASRKPRVLNYHIDDDGVQVGDKLLTFNTLRSFAVIDEGNFHSIMLLPTQRFMPAVSIYFEPQAESNIVQTLGSYLPQEERKQELIDKLMHKIRF